MVSEQTMKITVFILTFICMVSRHSCLEAWYIMKSEIEKSVESMNTSYLGAIDTVYLFFYAIGLFVSGVLEDHYSMKLIISTGMILASLVYFTLIGFTYLSIISIPMIIICWGLQGVLQSTVWPGTVALIANWFPKSSHGGWMGIWSCNSGLGNIVGSQLGYLVFRWTNSWELVLLTMTVFMFTASILTLLLVQDRPSEQTSAAPKKGISFIEAWKLPGVAIYSLSYACIKLLLYSLMMWLPYYLDSYVKAGLDEKTIIICSFDAGGLIGSVIAGYISDCTPSRKPVLLVLLAFSLPLLFCFNLGGPNSIWIYYTLVPFCGAFIISSANLVSTCVATDLAHYSEHHEGTIAMATVTGIIDGTGSLGAAFGQIVIGILSQVSWDYVFYFMMAIGVLSIILIYLSGVKATKPELEEMLIKN